MHDSHATDSVPPAPVAKARRAPTLAEVLARAGKLAAAQGVELDDFMRTAWNAYVEARPGLRAQLEEMRLVAELDGLRKAGKVGEA